MELPAEWDLLSRFSSLNKLIKVTAWIKRFIAACRHSSTEDSTHLSTHERQQALHTWVRIEQRRAFSIEVKALTRSSQLATSSPLIRLAPYIDEEGLLRIGGRLKHSLLDYNEHPLILPSKSPLTCLVVRDYHHRALHEETQLTLNMLRRQFWVLSGRRVVRTTIRTCVPCVRWRAATTHQKMSTLPKARVTPSRPFLNTGVDYAGPFLVRTAKGRGHKAHKSYLAIFVCLSTRAVHLELVSDYSTKAFLAAYRRFTGRRGICASLWSDRGTNFVGADSALQEMLTEASAEFQSMATQLANEGTQWKFNPPAAPHFGGLWEAGVKSVKHHLRRVIGDSTLTFEELYTVFTQIEACLNLRPLQALSDDPQDISALTPGHFLIGEALTTIPEPTYTNTALPLTKRWQLTRQMASHFWERWSAEYLRSMQARTKWHHVQPSVRVGDMCILKNELSPPGKWPLARVIETHPGDDGYVRVVTLKTRETTLRRPIAKLCMLPRADEPPITTAAPEPTRAPSEMKCQSLAPRRAARDSRAISATIISSVTRRAECLKLH